MQAALDILSQYLASVWLKKAAVNEYNNNLKNEILTGILSGDGDSSLLPKLKTLGLEKKGKFFVILIMIPEVENHLSYCETQEGASFLNKLDSLISGAGLKGIAIPEYHDVCLILSCGGARRKLHTLCKHSRRTDGGDNGRISQYDRQRKPNL